MSDVDHQKLLDVAIAATETGSAVLVEHYERYFGKGATEKMDIATKTAPNDVVTEVDNLAQKAIIAEIQKHFPDHRFIAEEKGADDLGDPECPYVWIIDPLDGTLNFTRGRNNFGTIVAVQHNDVLQAGSMRIPLLNQHFYGAREKGAYLNGEPIQLRATKNMADAVLSSNTIRRAKKDEQGVLQISTPDCASLENCGSAVDELGIVLQGKADGAFFRGIRIWDVAVGFLLIELAGGKMHYEFLEEGNPRSGLLCAASTEAIFDELWEFVSTKISS